MDFFRKNNNNNLYTFLKSHIYKISMLKKIVNIKKNFFEKTPRRPNKIEKHTNIWCITSYIQIHFTYLINFLQKIKKIKMLYEYIV